MRPEIIQLLWKPISENMVPIGLALILILLDVIVGFSNAVAHCEVSSSKMRTGLWHKIGSMFLMLTADIIDGALLGGFDIGFQAPVLISVCIYISVMEMVSVLENIAKLNPRLADNPIIQVLEKVKSNVEK